MTQVILIKHAQPEVDPTVSSPLWTLSEQGRRQCVWLAAALKSFGVAQIHSSLEPKALETASLVARDLGLPVTPRANLQENDRTGLGFLPQQELRQRLRDFFERPTDTIVGRETADDAFRRFDETVRSIAAEGAGESVAVVTHGTVLSLFVSRYNAIDPFGLWSRLALPSFMVLDAPSFRFDGAVHNHPNQEA